jgi:hypothetical protein
MPTIVELIDLPKAIEALVEETRGQQRSKNSPASPRGFFCVPSMIDSLEVEVLYPA